MTAVLCGALLSASAQEQDTTIYEFRPHWYIQGAFGYQYTIGETNAGLLSSPNAQVAFGYEFTPVWGLRVNVNGWQSRDGFRIDKDLLSDFATKTGVTDDNLKWTWYYVAPAVNVTMDLTNLFGGYKPDRIVNFGIFLGGGVNVFFKNDQAWAAYDVLQTYQPAVNNTDGTTYPGMGASVLQYIWGPDAAHASEPVVDKTSSVRLSPLAQGGLYFDFRITDKFRLGLEGQANLLHDRYNSKHAGNPDWYINALVTAKYNFGGTYNERHEKKPAPCDQLEMKRDTVYITIHDTLYQPTPEQQQALADAQQGEKDLLKTAVFYRISSSDISLVEHQKILNMVNYLRKHPNAKIVVTGYADKGTGTAEVNMNISKKRAQGVKDDLVKNYGVDADRIEVVAKGDTEQPFAEQILNRVSICVVE